MIGDFLPNSRTSLCIFILGILLLFTNFYYTKYHGLTHPSWAIEFFWVLDILLLLTLFFRFCVNCNCIMNDLMKKIN